jgi:hypothetical protein
MSKKPVYLVFVVILAFASFVGCSHSRTDADITSEVQKEINSDSNIGTKQVSVVANDGVVTVSGTVGNDFERNAASNDASQVRGVKRVLNNLHLVSETGTAPTQDTSPARSKRKPSSSPARRSTNASATPLPNPVSKQSAAVTIPDGTSLSIRLIDSIDSDRNKPGDTFSATLESPLVAEGRVVAPKNADVEGRVEELQSAGHFAGRSEIALVLTKLSFNGRTYEIGTDEYTQEGNSRGKRTAATVGGGAAVGALIGGLTGGSKGALIGAGLGAGAGTGVQAVTKGQQIRLASESILEFRLNTPLTIR